MILYRGFIKRLLDVLAAFIGLIFLSPLFLVVIVCLWIVNKGKVFFIQKRPGKNGQTFKLIKFKTMNDNVDESGALLPDSLRHTRIGKFLRSYSIDELPQLINILSGKMSFIGPRPLLEKYMRLYNSTQTRRHEIKPGLTGWAQVNGRNAISWSQKFEYDIYYVDNISFLLDLKIFILTVKKVFLRQGVNSSISATMPIFEGNSEKMDNN